MLKLSIFFFLGGGGGGGEERYTRASRFLRIFLPTSVSNQPNLFPVEIHLFFDVIVLKCDALRATMFKCH